MCVLFYKKNQEIVAKAFFLNVIKKIMKYFAKKKCSVFKGTIFELFEHTRAFFWQNFLFFVTFIKNTFAAIS